MTLELTDFIDGLGCPGSARKRGILLELADAHDMGSDVEEGAVSVS